MLVCPNCRKEHSKGNKYCSNCGSALVKLLLDIDESFLPQEKEEEAAVVVVCPKCGGIFHEVVNYCSKCGERLGEAIVSEPASGVPEQKEKVPEQKEGLVRCAKCYTDNPSSNIRCKACGSDLKKDTSELIFEKTEKEKGESAISKGGIEDIRKKQVVAKLTSYESMKLEDTSAIRTPQIIKCPNCNFLQEIGGDKCKKCGFLLTMPVPEISKVDLEEKAVIKEVPKKEASVIRETSKIKVPPIVGKRVARQRSFSEIIEDFTKFLSSRYGIGAGILIVVIAIALIFLRVSGKEKGKDKLQEAPQSISIFLEKIEVGEMPVIMKGYSEINLTTSVPVNVYIDDKDYGMTPIKGLLIPSGYHDLRFKNDEYLIDEIQHVYIIPGVPFERNLTLGHFASLNLNAIPWADVYIDGKYVGQTPIANLKVVVGAHEIVFKNSKFPIRRRNVSLEEGTTTDITVDMHFNQ